jgi:imidazolonepropionase-like amidohydrolase
VPSKGVIKGTSAVFALTDQGENAGLVRARAALHVSFEPPAAAGVEEYPDSRMGAYALARQAYYDAEWYDRALAAARDGRHPRPEANAALAALSALRAARTPVVIDAFDEQDGLRADRFGKEFALPVIVRGSGREYRRVADLKATGRGFILPVSFPRPPLVDTPELAANVSLEQLMDWDLAPENPARLARAGIAIALSSDRLDDKAQFLAGVRKAVERGLTEEQALAALTTTPAAWFGVDGKLGTLAPGKLAHFVITDGDVFNRRTTVREVWIDGKRTLVKARPLLDARGTWELDARDGATGAGWTLTVDGTADSLGVAFAAPGGRGTAHAKKVELLEQRLFASAPFDSLGGKGVLRFSATLLGDRLVGELEAPDGTHSDVTGRRTAPYVAPAEKPGDGKSARDAAPGTAHASYEPNYPLGECGLAAPPAQPAVVAITHADVWTCGPRGRIEDGTVVVRAGKIAAVGKDVAVPAGAIVVDAHGESLTPGIIDCHSHSATDGGINESGQTVTAEVRIGDFIDANDMAIYRELAGGLTEAHVLHGSANTIGGQCQLIKLRWSLPPEALKFEGYTPTIKFALGENVKQANWGERFTTRYPQTRMGVEQLLRDEFQAAKEYEETWRRGVDAHGFPPRHDLELDAMAEVLDGKRIIHCHSYRQDEIMGLVHVCDDFHVAMGTFQHVLEGYKIADELARRHIGGSTFSDWWAYKNEVVDAQAYNGALMHDVGVVVSYNSDSGELARRLNSEAGKAVKYGGVPPEEALKFVTLNPAIQLHVQDRVGSIEPGKDADLALWSGAPLEAHTRCEQTWIDGRKYFDRNDDLARRKVEATMRATLIQKALADPDAGGGGGGPGGRRGPRGDVYDEAGQGQGDDATDGDDADTRGDCGTGGGR